MLLNGRMATPKGRGYHASGHVLHEGVHKVDFAHRKDRNSRNHALCVPSDGRATIVRGSVLAPKGFGGGTRRGLC